MGSSGGETQSYIWRRWLMLNDELNVSVKHGCCGFGDYLSDFVDGQCFYTLHAWPVPFFADDYSRSIEVDTAEDSFDSEEDGCWCLMRLLAVSVADAVIGTSEAVGEAFDVVAARGKGPSFLSDRVEVGAEPVCQIGQPGGQDCLVRGPADQYVVPAVA